LARPWLRMQAENARGPELEEVVVLVVPMCATFALVEPQAETIKHSPTTATSPSRRCDVSTARAAAISSPLQRTDRCV
jgi:hypothetical protein